MEHTSPPADSGEPVEDTVVRARTREVPAASEAFSADLEDTVIGLIQPHAPAHERPESVTLASTASMVAIDAESTSGAQPPAPELWAVRIRGTEVTIPLDRPAVFGRSPRPSRVEENPPPRRVQIPSEHRDVSARHARIEQVGTTVVLTDLGSTNGIDVHWSRGSVSRLRPGETIVVLADAVVALGDAVVIEFVAAAPS